jgi:hypothetical protein
VTKQTVYREGSRIRATNGTGYSDAVNDDTIKVHIEESTQGEEHRLFAEAVLAIRAYEEHMLRKQRGLLSA